MNRSDLHKYQERGVDFIISHNACCLFLDMGLGKSVTTLTAISDLIDYCEISSILVIAPKKVAESTWAQEVAKWEHLRHLRVSVVLGTAKQRTEALLNEADIYVTSRDNVVWVLEQAQKNKKKFDMLVLDELTSFKNSAAKRFKALRKYRPFVSRCVGLTGTPTPNGLKDLWAQLYCVDMGNALGRSKTRFIDTFFDTYVRDHIMYNCTPKKGAEKEIYRQISPITLTMKAEDYLSLPPMIERDIMVTPSKAVMKRYEEFERDRVLEFASELENTEGNIIAGNAAALCNKLCQFANGAIYTEEHEVLYLHDEKLDMFAEIVEQAQAEGNSVLVFYQFKHDCSRIMSRPEFKDLHVRLYEGDHDLVDWNAGKIDILLTHAASTAYGLNLQRGGNVIVWYGTGWNAELYLQGNARLHRQGQQKPVTVFRLVVAGTMDETALKAIDNKVRGQEAMLNALKDRIKRFNVA